MGSSGPRERDPSLVRTIMAARVFACKGPLPEKPNQGPAGMPTPRRVEFGLGGRVHR
jgi:hypothetical protein